MRVFQRPFVDWAAREAWNRCGGFFLCHSYFLGCFENCREEVCGGTSISTRDTLDSYDDMGYYLPHPFLGGRKVSGFDT